MLRAGLRALAARDSPLFIPLRPDAGLLAFLAGFARNCTARRWQAAMTALVPLSRQAIGAFDALAAGGVQAATTEARPLLVGFTSAARRRPLLAELRQKSGAVAPRRSSTCSTARRSSGTSAWPTRCRRPSGCMASAIPTRAPSRLPWPTACAAAAA